MKRRNTKFLKSGGKRRSKLSLMVRDAMRRGANGRAFFQAGEKIGVAVSGGADSVALLRLLLELREELGIVVSAVHLNHQLRGRAADGDERFVAKLAEKYGIEFFAERANVAAKAKRESLNLEDAARRARYEFFEELVQDEKVRRVATAHTADDQAETVLAHILRGSGLAGIGGIHAVSGDVVRPLLGIRRAALRAYLKDAKQTWREDATNRDTTKLRARIRKKLIPLLEKQFQPATVDHLATLAEFARQDDGFFEFIAKGTNTELTRKVAEGIAIQYKGLSGPPSVSRRMIRRIVKEVKPRAGELGARQVEAVLDLAKFGENGKWLELPGGVEVRRDYDDLVFCAANAESPTKEFEYPIDLAKKEATFEVPCLERSFRFTMIDWSEKRVETSSNGSVLNLDTLRNPLVLRNWRPGDTFQPLGHRKPHKLKRLLNEKRISRWDRNGWPVLTSAGVIVWVRGFPVGAAFVPTAQTTSGVRVEECAS
ncbi:MAG TPA: tRNA lysidine(34) synthetase TilS [Candidatus Acidoferrum sp.]|jgi:tRNA(Ile)-lysidine synthase